MSIQLLVAYDTSDGHCAYAGQHLARGARAAGADVRLRQVTSCHRSDFRDLDGLILGSPVHQRGMSWPMKKFIDELCEPSWFYDDMVGRACGVFTTGGGHGNVGGGCEMAQLSMLANLAAMGCVMVPFPKCTRGFDVAGMHWGPHIRVTSDDMTPLQPHELPEEALDAVYHHGAAICRIAEALKRRALDGQLFDAGGRFPSREVLSVRSDHDGDAGAQGSRR
ncbi:hypothetical protein B4U45_22605 [Mycobacterium persicum]|nr:MULTISPECIES: NAD(P)H-dependent oxidoreductase [Mycobacterium]ORB96799.1 hypothetical protein B1T44_22465 [Mycobacterium persicum]ORJ52961.1 hypothetical protein B5M45_29535 [Mycobacterium simiae]RUP05950.1 MAG: flavodoxin family protein [Mycobacterium sp.]ATQ40820.1 flavodoxin family protein [Mycobacterium avium subsp. hominissuis]MCA2334219.1 flavodoxin family protein [Mycobacterium avium]